MVTELLNPLYRATLSDPAYLGRITCPIVFLSPSNDFHGCINDLQTALGEIQRKDWRVTCSPHHDHQDTEEYQVAGPLWFDQHLKENFCFPQTPELSLELKTSGGIPVVTVKPDASKTILGVDVYYTRHGQAEDAKDDMANAKTRFWRYSKPTRTGDVWTAELPLLETGKPLWVYANVRYPIDSPVKAAGYYYGLYQADYFNLSSRMLIATPEHLQAAGVKPTLQPSLVIETFENDWQKQWFDYDRTQWDRHTYKLRDPVWQSPAEAKLAIDIRAQLPNKLAIGLDNHSTEIQLKGGEEWQQIVLNPADFHDGAGATLSTWQGIRELRLLIQDKLRAKVDGKDKQLIPGAKWQGPQSEFRNLRWLKKPM